MANKPILYAPAISVLVLSSMWDLPCAMRQALIARLPAERKLSCAASSAHALPFWQHSNAQSLAVCTVPVCSAVGEDYSLKYAPSLHPHTSKYYCAAHVQQLKVHTAFNNSSTIIVFIVCNCSAPTECQHCRSMQLLSCHCLPATGFLWRLAA